MSEPRPVILDAGPCLAFCAAGKQRILHDTLTLVGDLMAPATVDDEIRHKARSDPRFARALSNWIGLVDSNRVELLPDEQTKALAAAVSRIDGTPFAERMRQGKNLGELMVIAHALVLREDEGRDVIVLIDDGAGARIASRWGLKVMNTEGVLMSAIRHRFITDKATMRATYNLLRTFDDGLVHIDQTRLLEASRWSGSAR
jgi:predicted nucleic acid-binding protein